MPSVGDVRLIIRLPLTCLHAEMAFEPLCQHGVIVAQATDLPRHFAISASWEKCPWRWRAGRVGALDLCLHDTNRPPKEHWCQQRRGVELHLGLESLTLGLGSLEDSMWAVALEPGDVGGVHAGGFLPGLLPAFCHKWLVDWVAGSCGGRWDVLLF